MTDALPEGNRNALLALHFEECGEREAEETRAHLEGCADCRAYLEALEQTERVLREWADETPPADLMDPVWARLPESRPPQFRPSFVPGPAGWSASPLFALLPVMAALVIAVQQLAARLAAWTYWPQLEQWPGVPFLGAFGVAALLLLVGGGLGSLAVAPALFLDNRKDL